jgi:hypothetical protein
MAEANRKSARGRHPKFLPLKHYWVLVYPTGIVRHESIRVTRRDAIRDAEKSMWDYWSELKRAGWRCVKVRIVAIKAGR